jgi:glyoxylase-like metal-dependent hydrolase (beta-lactamase superfamily II)
MAATVHPFNPHLFLIELAPAIDGFQGFVGAWLVTGPEAVYLVDVGPAATGDQLIDAIDKLGVEQLDYICLTHIHMDHAGAVGHLSRRFPDALVICHPKGTPHIVDPEKLWQGTVKTLGDTGRAYGRMVPVNPSRIASEKQAAAGPFELVDTPGHSPHHLAIAADDFVFAGEAGGVCLPLPSGAPYLRPATPPRFFMDVTLSSLDRLMTVSTGAVCYGHFGMREDGPDLLARHRRQLLLWQDILSAEVQKRGDISEEGIEACVELMLATDPNLIGFAQLPPVVQQRERGFLRNSVKGFTGYLASR